MTILWAWLGFCGIILAATTAYLYRTREPSGVKHCCCGLPGCSTPCANCPSHGG